MKKDFQKWFLKKETINKKNQITYFRKKEIWWCALGCNVGFEQDGKNENFERPVLVIKKINNELAFIVPLSTKIKKDLGFYHTYKYNNIEYSALISQLKVVSSKRFLRKFGILNKQEFTDLVESVFNFMKK